MSSRPQTLVGPFRGSSVAKIDLVSLVIGPTLRLGSVSGHRSVVGPGNRNTGLIAKEACLVTAGTG